MKIASAIAAWTCLLTLFVSVMVMLIGAFTGHNEVAAYGLYGIGAVVVILLGAVVFLLALIIYAELIQD